MPKPLLRLFSGGPPAPPAPPAPTSSHPGPPPITTDRSTLNASIAAGIRLRKAATRDRSAPAVVVVDGNVSSGGNSCFHGDTSPVKGPGGDGAGMVVGGMPKLRSRGGGVETGASRSSSYMSSPEPSTSPAATSALCAPTIPTRPVASTTTTRRPPPPVPAHRPTSATHHRRSAPSSPPPHAPPRPPGLRKTSAPLLSANTKEPLHTIAAPKLKPPATAHSSLPASVSASPPMSPALVAARKATAGRAPPPEPPSRPVARARRGAERERAAAVEDGRWRFRREEDLPEPRACVGGGGGRVYRSGGTGSTVPLDWGLLG